MISAPGNEVRGYYLQPKDRRLPVAEFFKPERFVRSTSIGAMIMSTALGVSTLATGPATDVANAFKTYLNEHPSTKAILAVFVMSQYFHSGRHNELMEVQKAQLEAMKKDE